MRYLIVSSEGKSVGLARKLEKEGHSVNVHIVRPSCQRKAAGVVSVLKTPRPIMDAEGVYNISAVEHLMGAARPDITIFDAPDMRTMATRMQKAGHRVIGATEDAPTALHSERDGGRVAAVEAWFNGEKFVAPFSVSFLYEKLMVGDVGPYAPGSMGMITMFVPRANPMAQLLVNHLEVPLRASSYRGPARVYTNLAHQVVGQEVSLGPTNYGTYESLFGSISQFLVSIVNGSEMQHRTLTDYVVSVRISLPPWPYSVHEQAQYRVPGINEGNLKHLWMNDLAYSATDGWHTTGESNDIGFVTARGEKAGEAVRRAYRTIENLSMPSLQFRTDIGEMASVVREFCGV